MAQQKLQGAVDLSKITQARYIKLGSGGKWEDLCFSDNTLRLGYHDAPHALAAANDFEGLKQHYLGTGDTHTGAASSHARQILDFYKSGPDTLWITFSNGFLWWCIATSDVEYFGSDRGKYPDGSRLRRTDGWHNTNLRGEQLLKSGLSGHLTRVEGYRGTICDVKANAYEYLMRKIKGEVSLDVSNAERIKTELLGAITILIRQLTWQDFELLVDLIFTQGGWRRIAQMGGTAKTVDLELMQPMTGERAAVQIKSATDQHQLDEYIARFEGMSAEKYFYAYHTNKSGLINSMQSLTMLGPDELSAHVLNCGLLDWLLEKAG